MGLTLSLPPFLPLLYAELNRTFVIWMDSQLIVAFFNDASRHLLRDCINGIRQTGILRRKSVPCVCAIWLAAGGRKIAHGHFT